MKIYTFNSLYSAAFRKAQEQGLVDSSLPVLVNEDGSVSSVGPRLRADSDIRKTAKQRNSLHVQGALKETVLAKEIALVSKSEPAATPELNFQSALVSGC